MATYYSNSNNTIPKLNINSQFQINGQSVDEWVNADPNRTFSQFYEVRTKNINQALEDSLNLSQSPINLSGVYSNVLNSNDFTNYINFNNNLEKAKNIVQNQGKLIGFDTETIGNLNKPILTEIGWSEIEVANNNIINTQTHSLPLILDKPQADYLLNVKNKFFANGFDALNQEEKSTIEWASRYGNLKLNENIINNNGVFEILKLNTPNYDMNTINSAFDYLTTGKIGNQTGLINSRESIYNVVDYLSSQSKEATTALYIANGKFDTNALYQEMISNNNKAYAQKVLDLKNDVIDTISIDRVNSSILGLSPSEYLRENYGISVPGVDVESQMKARLIPNTHMHVSGTDSLDEGYVLFSQLQQNLANAEDVSSKINNSSIDDIFYFHHGRLNQTNGREFGIVNGQVTPNISITQDFWQIDKARSGVLNNGLERLTFTNYTDIKNGVENPMQFSIERTHDEIADFLNRNAFIQDKSDVNKRLVSGTQEIKYKDIANREFNRILDASAVTKSSGENYLSGFDKLKSYLTLNNKLGLDDYEFKSNTESLNKLSSAIQDYNIANPEKAIKMSSYEMQAFIGMQDLLKNEGEMLSDIINTIDSKQGLDNLQKTVLLSNAYNSAISELETIGNRTRKRVPQSINNIADTNSIVLNLDNQIYRINTMNDKTKVNSINNILNSMSYNTDSMGKGGFVDTNKVNDFINVLYDNDLIINKFTYTLKNSSSDFNYDLAQLLSTEIPNGTSFIQNQEDSLAYKLSTSLNKKYSTGTLKELYTKNKEDVINSVANSIVNTPYIEYSNYQDKNILLETLSNELNYKFEPKNNPIKRLFTNSNGFDSEYARKNNLISILITPESDKASAYVLTTRQQDYGKLADKISKGDFNFSSWKTLKSQEDNIFNYAMVTELPYIHKYNLNSEVSEAISKYGIGTLSTIEQGIGNQKFIIPTFNTYTDSNGILKGYLNSGEFEVIRSYDKTLKQSMEYAAQGEYSRASSILRQPRDAYLSAMSSSSTYYNTVLSDGTVKRILNFSPSDYLQGFKMNITGNMETGVGGLYSVFGNLLNKNTDNINALINPNNIMNSIGELSEAQRIVYYIGQSSGRTFNKNQSITGYLNSVYETPEFKEFFLKNLFLQSPSQDIQLQSKIDTRYGLSNNNIFDLMYQNRNLFDKSISDSLEKINTIQKELGQLPNQIISESALRKGDISLGVNPGTYNPLAPLNNTIRPQYSQTLNTVMFTPDELVADNLFGVDISQGTISKTYKQQKENLIKAFAEDTPAGMENYVNSQTNFTAKVTFMSDWDLQKKYLSRAENAINNNLGLSEQEYKDVLNYMSREYSSFAEDKTFISPALAETELFSKREAKKIELNLEDIDIDKTRKLLLEDTARVYDSSTPIAISKSGRPIFKNTTGIKLDEIAINELLDTGRTLAPIASYGDTMDVKLMIGGSEKSIAHAISTESFMNYMIDQGYTNYDKQTASKIANAFFEDIFGASIVGNINFSKHGNMGVAMSYWNTIEQAYRQNNQLDSLVNILNSTASRYERINPFEISNGLIVTDWENAKNLSGFINDVYTQLTEYNVGNTESNKYLKDLVNSMAYSSDNGYYQLLLNVQRQSVNEHMGKSLTMDWRMQQGILARGIDPLSGELNENNRIFYELLRDYSGANLADAYRDSIKSNKYASTTKYFNQFTELSNAINSENIAKNSDNYIKNVQRSSAVKTARGIGLVNDFMSNPQNFDDFNRVLTIDSRDLLDIGTIPEGIEDIKELENSIFYINGKPSQKLKNLQEAQNINNAYAIRVNLGKEINLNGQTVDNILVPIQNINTIGDNEAFYSKQGIETRKFLNRIINDIKNPSENSNLKIASAYNQYANEIVKQFNTLDKNSDLVRYLTEYELPNSTFALGQDEASMLTIGMLRDENLNTILESIQKTRGEIKENPTLNNIELLDTLEKELSDTLEQYAKKAETGDLIDEIASNMANRAFDISYINIDNKRYFAPVVAVSEDTLKAMNLNLSEVGMQTLLEYESPTKNGIYIPNNYFNEEFLSRRNNLINRLNQIENLNISESDDILKQVNKYLKQYHPETANIKDLNKARIAGASDDITAIFNAFQDEGKYYMERVGTYGLYNRYPSFRSYPVVKYTLDTSMQGKQMRFSNGLFSSISNIDFDGDIAGASLLLEGSGIARQSNKLYQAAESEYLRYVQEDTGKAITELIRNADAFKYNSDTFGEQLVSQLKIANKSDIVDEALETLSKSDNEIFKGITKEAIESSSGLALAVYSSQEFLNIVTNLINKSDSGLNMVTDKNMQLATIAAEIRKADIGYVSTTSFKARDNLLRALNSAETYGDKYKILRTYSDLSNMESKFGGMFSAAEQSAIDTKKALDGLKLASVSQYSTGIGELTRYYENQTENALYNNRRLGSQKIFDAIGEKIFKDTDPANFEKYSEMIASLSFEDFDNYLNTLQETGSVKINGIEFNPSNIEELRALRGLRGLSEISNENISYRLGTNMQKGGSPQRIKKDLANFSRANEQLVNNLINVKNSSIEPIVNAFAYTKGNNEDLVEGMLYFTKGDLQYPIEGYLFSNNKFKEINLATGEILNSSAIKRKNLILDISGITSIFEYKASDKLRNDTINTMVQRTSTSLLDEMFINKTIVPADIPNVAKNLSSLPTVAYFENIRNITSGDFNQILDKVNKISVAYDLAVRDGMTIANAPGSGAELIKALNKNIAENPEIYKQSYDSMLEGSVLNYLNKNVKLSDYYNNSSSLQGLNISEVEKSIANLKQEILDVNSSSNALNQSFETLQEELTALEKQGLSKDILNKFNIKNDLTEEITSNISNIKNNIANKESIINTQLAFQDLYNKNIGFASSLETLNLFNNTKQLDAYFNFANPAKAKVGITEYIGESISDLSKSDIINIRDSLKNVNLDELTSVQKYSYTKTLELLDGVEGLAEQKIKFNTTLNSGTKSIIDKNSSIALETWQKIKDLNLDEQTQRKLRKEASKIRVDSSNASKRTFSNAMSDGLDSVSKMLTEENLKKGSIAAGILVGVGIAGKLLHQKTGSPLTPKVNHPQQPTIDNNSVQWESPQEEQMSSGQRQRKIYVDENTGLQFRVRADTKKQLDYAKLANNMNKANPSSRININARDDTSKITDNWLANKFAQLSE